MPNVILDSDSTSRNFRWTATVAGFGMMLRGSGFIQEVNFADLISLGSGAVGEDLEGYRAEMIEMMKNTQSMGISKYNSGLETSK